MRLAFFSPLNPQPSGISDYSEELLPHLADAGAQIDLFVEGFAPSNREVVSRFRVFDYVKDPSSLARLGEYDAALYHLGNDHRYHAGLYDAMRARPGVAVFHDFALQDFFLGLARSRGDLNVYLDEVEAEHGPAERAAAEASLRRGGTPAHFSRPLGYPLNLRLARAAEGIIVHSRWARARFSEIAPGVPVAQVNHHITPRAAREPERAARRDGGPVSVASFGIITPDKGVELVLAALGRLRTECDFRYTLVGAPSNYFDVRALVELYNLQDRVEVTGHVPLQEFERRIAETDIAVNLRARTSGETSGSLCRVMAGGVAALVSNVGWFAELPDDAVVKVDADEYAGALVEAYLRRLLADAPLREKIGRNARRHVLAEHDIRRSAAGYLDFIAEVVSGRARRRLVAGVSKEVASLGLDADRDSRLLARVASELDALAPKHTTPTPQHTTTIAHAPAARPAPAPSHDGRAASVEAHPNGGGGNGDARPGRLKKVEGIDYKRAAVEYPSKLDAERRHYLYTKPFYNLANKPPKHEGDGLDEETHRHFCDFANLAAALALPAGRRILDVGCGSGWLSEYFARLGYDVTGIDISPDLIEIARDRVARVPYDVDHETGLRCRFLVHDAEGSPLEEEFDAVVCYDSLHHFEDERAVMRNLARMTARGGMLFVLEGDRPDEGSATEEELVGVMERFETLESPFSRDYLRALLVEHGFAVVGDFVNAAGLFERESLVDGRVPVETTAVNYLLCKKVVGGVATAADVPLSDAPGRLAARLTVEDAWPDSFAAGESARVALAVENTGDTVWLKGTAARRGAVMIALRLFDASGALVEERHGEPPLPRALAPGEGARVALTLRAPDAAGPYTLKIDLVAQHVAWFEQRGSEALALPFVVRAGES
ncbi:MAG TPA: methyltransferase domain-containing protein [Pyrinomonadaceae bacterium]|nr:methyltransferase domain-containing protein [Pyrinomonadaceae bacterium]